MEIFMKIQFDTFCYRNCEHYRVDKAVRVCWWGYGLHPGIDSNCQPNKLGLRWDKRIHAHPPPRVPRHAGECERAK